METDEFGTVLFFCSISLSEAGLNEIRVPRDRLELDSRQGNHVRRPSTTFILSLVAIGQGRVSLIRLSFLYCNWGLSLASDYNTIILNCVLAVLYQKGRFHLVTVS